jgi:hypothetical protein
LGILADPLESVVFWAALAIRHLPVEPMAKRAVRASCRYGKRL